MKTFKKYRSFEAMKAESRQSYWDMTPQERLKIGMILQEQYFTLFNIANSKEKKYERSFQKVYRVIKRT
jgi:hypothetical protein